MTTTAKHTPGPCSICGDELKPHEHKTCFTCTELENNRRYRLHNRIGEYAPEAEDITQQALRWATVRLHNPERFTLLRNGDCTLADVEFYGLTDEQLEDMARFIVTACNAHYELLEALKSIEANLTGQDCFAERVADSLRRATAAIARAEGSAE